MKIVCVGDNVVDCYLDQQLYYPGGNAVNVAVNCSRYGAEATAYIGVFGNDPEADHLKWALDQEGIVHERSRTVYAASGRPQVKLTPDGDRVFVGGPLDTAQHLFRIRLTEDDRAYIGGFDVCHTSCYSGTEPELRSLSAVTDVSFDFSTRNEEEYVRDVARHVRYAFFSGSELTERQLEDTITICHDAGTEIVGITRGQEGALFSLRGKRFVQHIKPVVRIVDTMGAGDSFIAGFLTMYSENGSISDALDFAAEKAARTCGFFGGFGYPHAFESRM